MNNQKPRIFLVFHINFCYRVVCNLFRDARSRSEGSVIGKLSLLLAIISRATSLTVITTATVVTTLPPVAREIDTKAPSVHLSIGKLLLGLDSRLDIKEVGMGKPTRLTSGTVI